MSIARTASPPRRLPRFRLASLILPLAGLAAVAAVVAIVVMPMLGGNSAETVDNVLVQMVALGTFEHNVVEPGELESSSNVEVRCEVEARNSAGTTIIEIVPNGTDVQPGDLLVRFDSSALEQEINQQQIVVNDTKALVIQAQTGYDTAVIAEKEYLEGTFKQEEQVILGELFVAEENLRRAEEYAKYSERLAAKGYVTSEQVEADKFAVDKSRNDVAAVKTKLKVLREFTKAKLVKTLDSAIETAKANLESDQYTLRLAEEKLAHIKTQITKCKVLSPATGKVVYASRTDRRGGLEVIIEEGTVIRERQPVMRIPDLSKMQVQAKVNESRISFVKRGMEALVRVDAFPGMELKGKVIRVDEYPAASGWFSANIKQYATFVQIDDPPEGVRPGLTAQVQINIERIPDALKLPVQAVLERNGEYYCVVRNGQGMEPRWLDIGPTNDQEVLVRTGVKAGDNVVLNPDPYVADVKLPGPPPGYWDAHPRYESLARKTNGAKAEVPTSREANGDGPRAEQNGATSGTAPGDRPRDPASRARGMFERFDANSDGVVALDELPDQARERFGSADTDGDGKITQAEMTALMSRLPPRGAGGRGGPPQAAAGGAP